MLKINPTQCFFSHLNVDFFLKISTFSELKIPKNVDFFEDLENFRSQIMEIAPETCKNVKKLPRKHSF